MDEEKLIPVNVPPYPFTKEDVLLVSRVVGLTISHTLNPHPFRPVFHFWLEGENTFQDIVNFIESLPDDFELVYFRPFAPGQHSSGTVVTAQKTCDGYLYYNGSHGQDNIWRIILKNDLLQELFVNRAVQTFGTIRISRKYKNAVLGQKAYLLLD